MSMGVQGAEAQPHETQPERAEEQPWEAAADPGAWPEHTEEAPRRGIGVRIFAGFLILLALGWIGASGYALSQAWPGPSLSLWTQWTATISAPLILIGLAWLIFGRSSRRETKRFTAAVRAMRSESAALEAVLAATAQRLADNRSALAEETARLMGLGEEASDRLGRVTQHLSRETADLDRKAQALDVAAAAARVDIGVLMGDLPRAEEQARAVAAAMKEAGLGAHEQAAALESQLAALSAKAREADEGTGGAAQRLGAHIARIESGAEAAAARMNAASAEMQGTIDGAMSRAAEAVDQTRAGLEAQGQTMLAMIEQSRVAFERAGADTTKGLAERLDLAGAKIEMLAGRLATQDQASRTLLANIARQIEEVGAQIAHVGASGDEQNARLTQSMGALRSAAQELQREVEAGHAQSGELIGRTGALSEALGEVTRQLRDEMPPAMAGVEIQAERTAAAAAGVTGQMKAMHEEAGAAARRTEETERSIERQREALAALLATLEGGAREAEEKLRALGALVGEADEATAKLVRETAPELVETLVRVRDSANQAASHAREAIAAVIPASVEALVEASRSAVSEAMAEPVRDQLAEIANASHLALSTAKAASERLTRQLLTIGETAAAIEGRINDDRAEREERDAQELSRRVSLLIDALNSTAIDVSKILSNDAGDAAWAAYLKGDRGAFTRRAVRLLDSGEAREILRHYEEEPEFRDQVNRYIADFEALLRRVLSETDGSSLGITLLSSDMGKLYVALAQAIERLRK
ncbi:MAG: hypothetical protein E6G92_05555 [Alphaproteobacteria bacterium]|nr:MAG: hypothetical protein E6G92_05555 [Alphaproteobacteria bacterium]